MITAGVFVGEFGYELFCWSGHLRARSQKEQMTIFAKAGHELLYEDFAKCVTVNIKTHAQNGPHCEKHSPFIVPNEYKHLKNIKSSNFDKTKPSAKYVKFGSKSNSGDKHVLLHLRKKCSDRDWNSEKWKALLNELDYDNFSYKFVGSLEQSIALTEYPIEDRRGISLRDLSNLMADSQTIIGPSSGIMHFATLCGLHQTVWSSSINKRRYLQDWNPLNTKVTFLDSFSFDPPVDYILKEVNRVIK